jgi:hypothetical protein
MINESLLDELISSLPNLIDLQYSYPNLTKMKQSVRQVLEERKKARL